MASPAKNVISGQNCEKAWESFEAKDYEKAVEAFEAVLKKEKKNADASLGLGRSLIKLGNRQKAVRVLKDALKTDPSYIAVHKELGDIYLEAKSPYDALEYYSQAVAYDPKNVQNMQRLVDIASGLVFKNTNPNFKGLMTECLESQEADFKRFGTSWLSVLTYDKDFAPLLMLFKHSSYSAFAQALQSSKNLNAFLDPFFLTGLGRFIVASDNFERWTTYLRRFMLETYAEGKKLFPDEEAVEFLHCAVSRYAFFTDYILNETEKEIALLEPLKEKLESSDTPSLAVLGLYSCYRPPYTLKNAKAIAKSLPGGDHVSQIPKSQIEDYFLQQEIKKDIVAITKIEDSVSAAVREQYEEFPYPRWETPFKGIYREDIEGRFIGKKAKILIAGTGTGQEAIELAFGLPDAEILAVDLSRTSLAYAIMRARQVGVTNITFRQADINELGSIGQTFDYITSSGVLHHMKDPEAGWKVLLGLLNPGGLMRIALYSRLARVSVTEARRVVAEKNIGNDTASIRAFRANIAEHIKHKYIGFFRNSYDYYSLPMCRDLIFHVQEHQFDLLQIKDMLDRFGLRFLGFNLGEDIFRRYKAFTKGKDEMCTDLEFWHKYEEKNTDTFLAMHAFWCEKK